jgi:transcriptional regulator with PAS, ATPase and Fis domain/polyferredoxin
MSGKKIGDYLVEANIIDQQTVHWAIEKQQTLKKEGIFLPLGKILTESFGVSETDLDKAVKDMAFDVLSTTHLFANVSREEVESTIEDSGYLLLKDNEVIFRHGDEATSFFIIISGKVKIFLPSNDGTENILTIMGAGEILGEMALMTGEKRSASATTTEETCLLEFSKAFLEQHGRISSAHSSALIKTLAQRLIRSSDNLMTATENERTYQQLLSERGVMIIQDIIGTSRNIDILRDKISRAAENESPVIIYGETGTEKVVAANVLHKLSIRAKAPFLSMNTEEAILQETRSLFQEEILQDSIIFGHAAGAIPSMAARRLGLLEICREGTLVIENIDRLTDGVQKKLLDFMTSGAFQPFGETRQINSRVRLIATSVVPLEELVSAGKFNRELFAALNFNAMTVPPLRKRKSDLRLIVDALIDWECNKDSSEGKQIKTISEEAYQRIMQYDWSGNMEELAIVIRRAINLAQHDILLPEDIFIGMVPPSGKYTFNLLRLEKVQSFFAGRYYPIAFQVLTGLVFLVIIILALIGSPTPDNNVSVILVWAIWWPMLVLSWFVGARIWCSICPMGAVSDLMSTMCSFKLKVPAFIRNYGLYLSAVGLGIIIWAESASNMTHSPRSTAMLLIAIVLCAMISGVLYERRLWCRYLCPLGRLAGVFSSCAVVEWRSNLSICNNICKTNQCFKGTEAVRGCPVYQGPFSLKSNQNCIFCGKCIKVCEHASPALNIRVPGHEIWAVLKPDKGISVFIPVILGTQIFRGIAHAGQLLGYEFSMNSQWAFQAMLLMAATALAFIFVHVSGKLSFGPLLDPATKRKDLFCYAIIPLTFAFEFGYHIETFHKMTGHILPVTGRQLGLDFAFLDFSQALGSPFPWQFILVTLGACISIWVLGRLMQKHQKNGAWRIKIINTLPITILAFTYFWIFVQR